MARQIVANAKMRRTGICGATETLLLDRPIATRILPLLKVDYTSNLIKSQIYIGAVNWFLLFFVIVIM